MANGGDSDYIYMRKNGKIVQSGAHKALIEATGAYEQLYRYQSELEAYGKEAAV